MQLPGKAYRMMINVEGICRRKDTPGAFAGAAAVHERKFGGINDLHFLLPTKRFPQTKRGAEIFSLILGMELALLAYYGHKLSIERARGRNQRVRPLTSSQNVNRYTPRREPPPGAIWLEDQPGLKIDVVIKTASLFAANFMTGNLDDDMIESAMDENPELISIAQARETELRRYGEVRYLHVQYDAENPASSSCTACLDVHDVVGVESEYWRHWDLYEYVDQRLATSYRPNRPRRHRR
ncbi:hypothetical protein BT63DRAFT_45045 [Microthyrium microscopicum]|uniref:Uncharacterized protein n=1 Tax=Microthyrium microscopicum TaxID=703497 RepID=A0A6A6U0Z3_9PEZI|nr:hypothetical protein BT63DRAFT_45045 [Microthyrium microscopicum]